MLNTQGEKFIYIPSVVMEPAHTTADTSALWQGINIFYLEIQPGTATRAKLFCSDWKAVGILSPVQWQFWDFLVLQLSLPVGFSQELQHLYLPQFLREVMAFCSSREKQFIKIQSLLLVVPQTSVELAWILIDLAEENMHWTIYKRLWKSITQFQVKGEQKYAWSSQR